MSPSTAAPQDAATEPAAARGRRELRRGLALLARAGLHRLRRAGGPLVEATHGRLGCTAPLSAITAAVVGVMPLLAGSALAGLAVSWLMPLLP